MLGRTLRLPAPSGLPARPLPAGDPPAARCPLSRSVAAAGCNQFKGLGPRSRRGEPGAALGPCRPGLGAAAAGRLRAA